MKARHELIRRQTARGHVGHLCILRKLFCVTFRNRRSNTGPFRLEEYTFFPSHSARTGSFHHYGKNDTVLSGIRGNGPACPTAARPAGGGCSRPVRRASTRWRPARVTGRGARMAGIRRQEAQSEQAVGRVTGEAAGCMQSTCSGSSVRASQARP
jgi:hypothetical protein